MFKMSCPSKCHQRSGNDCSYSASMPGTVAPSLFLNVSKTVECMNCPTFFTLFSQLNICIILEVHFILFEYSENNPVYTNWHINMRFGTHLQTTARSNFHVTRYFHSNTLTCFMFAFNSCLYLSLKSSLFHC